MTRIFGWIEIQEFNTDDEIFDISDHTVKVSNWEKTICIIPTYALISNRVKNDGVWNCPPACASNGFSTLILKVFNHVMRHN